MTRESKRNLSSHRPSMGAVCRLYVAMTVPSEGTRAMPTAIERMPSPAIMNYPDIEATSEQTLCGVSAGGQDRKALVLCRFRARISGPPNDSWAGCRFREAVLAR